jgi:hypothetical protein
LGIETNSNSIDIIKSDTKPILIGNVNQVTLSDTQPSRFPSPTSNALPAAIEAVYLCRPRSRVQRFSWMLVGVVCVLLPLIYTTSSYSFYSQEYGYLPAIQWSYPWILVSCFSLLVYSFLTIWQAISSLSRITVYENGITIFRSPGKPVFFAFRSISGITIESTRENFFGILVREKYTIGLRLENGKVIKIGRPFCGLAELSIQLREKIYPFISPAIEADLRQKRWVSFGAMKMNQAFVQIGRTIIPFKAISSIEVNSGILTICYHPADAGKTKAQKIQIPTRDIVNLELFLKFIQSGGSS